MITYLFIKLAVMIGAIIFYILPVVTVADIPYIGQNVSETLITAVKIWNTFMETLPYVETTWNIFLLVILPFEILMLIGKFFLGHRMPNNLN